MRKLQSAELFLGQTAKRRRYKIYLVDVADTTGDKYWLEGGSRNTRPHDPSLPDQRAGFEREEDALSFARDLVQACGGEALVLPRHKGHAAQFIIDDREPIIIREVHVT